MQLFCTTRSGDWWDHIVLETFFRRDWTENFRMSHEKFQYICEQLRPSIHRNDTRLRRAVSVEKRIAVTLWCLATSAEYRTISHLFGIGRSTVCEIVQETCKSIVKYLQPQYIRFPSGGQVDSIVRGFEEKWGIPQCIGAVDGSHVPVCAPTLNHTDYYNRKGWYSVIVQADVDHRYRFIDVYTGWPGSVHDARVFAHSSLYRNGTNGTLLPPSHTRQISGVDLPLFLVGESAYPLLTWLMKPFPQSFTTSAPNNYRLSRGRILVENAFGRLKARWRRRMKRNDMQVENIPIVVVTACVLHNICEVHNETFDDSWLASK